MIDMNPLHQAMTDLAARMSSKPAPAPQTSAARRDECFAAIDAMSAEIARLRAALERIDRTQGMSAATAMRAIAQRALAGE